MQANKLIVQQEKQFNAEGSWRKRKKISSVMASGLNSLTTSQIN